MSSGTNKRYPPELRERAVRMVAEVQHEYPSEWAAVESVADKLGIRRAQTDAGERPGVTSEMAAEMRKLRAENRELKRANEILKSASVFRVCHQCSDQRQGGQEGREDPYRVGRGGLA
ncbi:hypothetical protein CJ178_01795 [Rhodococcus sp. ACPA4]|nr:hypothetical protein CJ178_01795 [Rhodococcus sp. ACPA4]